MDSYPGDLLAGAFPLVFAVDAILPPSNDDDDDGQAAGSGSHEEEEEEGTGEEEEEEETPAPTKYTRGMFDRFLDAIAASLVTDDHQDDHQPGDGYGDESTAAPVKRKPAISVFLPHNKSAGDNTEDQYDDSSSSDEETDNTKKHGIRAPSPTMSSLLRRGAAASKEAALAETASVAPMGTAIRPHRPSFTNPALGFRKYVGLGVVRHSSAEEHTSSFSSSLAYYAKALRPSAEGGFFQQARIVPVSVRHAFPPSKDPDGTNNRAVLLAQIRSTAATGANALRLQQALRAYPVDGILPSGWLEKHVHALPSVLLLVTTLLDDDDESTSSERKDERHVMETLEMLRSSLAPKRECRIHLVCIITTTSSGSNSSSGDTNERIASLTAKCKLAPTSVTVLRVPDDLHSNSAASPGEAVSPALRRLHKSVRDASMAYYLGQARRAKRKHGLLGHERSPPPDLLPLAVRYCFKIGVFYEFQHKPDKSVRYFAEAYRHMQVYYKHLMQQAASMPPPPPPPPKPVVEAPTATKEKEEPYLGGTRAEIPQRTPPRGTVEEDEEEGHIFTETTSPSYGDGGVEVELVDETLAANEYAVGAYSNNNNKTKSDSIYNTSSINPIDMMHQCRAVADWLNFKLLQAGFLSSEAAESLEQPQQQQQQQQQQSDNGGLVAAASQWRRHCQVFLAKPRPEKENPLWNHWTFVAHQRLVISQLAERHPSQQTKGTDAPIMGPFAEALLQCSAWRQYASTAEAILRLRVVIQEEEKGKVKPVAADNQSSEEASMRQRFVGGLDSEGLLPKLRYEASRNHYEVALECVSRALSLLDRDCDSLAQDVQQKRSYLRLRYLAGSILVACQRYEEAVTHLEHASKHVAGWRGLELAVRRLLSTCYENCKPVEDELIRGRNFNALAMILDPDMSNMLSAHSSDELVKQLRSVDASEQLIWKPDSTKESTRKPPFSFSITFPSLSSVVAGDSLSAVVSIHSHLRYSVIVKAVTLLSTAGQVEIPTDRLKASALNPGSDIDDIVVNPDSSILFQVEIPLPTDLVASDGSSEDNKTASPSKGTPGRTPKPRSAGLTAAAGGCLISSTSVSEASNIAAERRNTGTATIGGARLGGTPVSCDGVVLTVIPLLRDSSCGRATMISLRQRKKMAHPNAKKTPFEEENYVAVSWERPIHHPLSYGPRSVRALGPMAQMKVENLTAVMTGGKVLEGTVNRVLLKLQAGDIEQCRNVKCRVELASTVVSSNQGKDDSAMDGGDTSKFDDRRPVLVKHDENLATPFVTPEGIGLPAGWKLMPTAELTTIASALGAGETQYYHFDVYRELSSRALPSRAQGESENCTTEFRITISYEQVRYSPVDQSALSVSVGQERRDHVDLEITGSLVWCLPVVASFSASDGQQEAFPSGNKHPLNALSASFEEDDSRGPSWLKSKTPSTPDEGGTREIATINGDNVLVLCSLRTPQGSDNLAVEVTKVEFEHNAGANVGFDQECDLKLVGIKGGNEIYVSKPSDVSHLLKKGSSLRIAYNVQTNLSGSQEEIDTHLGAVRINYRAAQLPLPEEVRDGFPANSYDTQDRRFTHGPLALSQPSCIIIFGPRCHVRRAPFEAALESSPYSPRVAVPFELRYRVANKSADDQALTVSLKEPSSEVEGPEAAFDGLLVSGMMDGEINLSPFESRILSYTALATRAGRTPAPLLSVSSARHETWVIDERRKTSHYLFVLP